ncbi:hypothetical protein GOP47_0026771 [Adiantum capillus-veneris]|nr:hypothetical protein GOP47_0026771 [Adiantum capillus-veneris]
MGGWRGRAAGRAETTAACEGVVNEDARRRTRATTSTRDARPRCRRAQDVNWHSGSRGTVHGMDGSRGARRHPRHERVPSARTRGDGDKLVRRRRRDQDVDRHCGSRADVRGMGGWRGRLARRAATTAACEGVAGNDARRRRGCGHPRQKIGIARTVPRYDDGTRQDVETTGRKRDDHDGEQHRPTWGATFGHMGEAAHGMC